MRYQQPFALSIEMAEEIDNSGVEKKVLRTYLSIIRFLSLAFSLNFRLTNW